MNAKNSTGSSSINMTFTKKDEECLARHGLLAETIADLIGPHCEVVIHSFKSFEDSVVKIVNGHHTGRKIGAPITDLGLKVFREFEETGVMAPKSYFTKNKDGSLMKSTSCILTGEDDRAVGMFCININLSHPFPEIMKTLMPGNLETTNLQTSENFSTSPSDIIEQALSTAIHDIENNASVNAKGRKKAITRILFDNGIFEFKEATTIVADGLQITRHAVYKYIREFKSQLKIQK
ncbi:hypothetical protein EOPP23_11610 [Endozoicomonas sp. OPT23]|uniref:helix-turn-helix transcriptional regulator n=1 Tax=Endozoicomonas sp. OPT23 TaxID=2072845 RepID=UPI00129BBD60|nr:PAS domain-containing protein [Endozoicomonas sp. OPT23]MRI33632.1 hypothetical protein [Endozoicomonas sp. OPT23]